MASTLTLACAIQDTLGMTVTLKSMSVIQHRARTEECVMISWLTFTAVVQLVSMENPVKNPVLRVVLASTVLNHVIVPIKRVAMR